MYESLLKFTLGLVLLLFSTHKLIKLAEKISHVFRISPLIVGMTVVALGTSLPELTVSAISAFRGDVGLALGNIIGSNIVNILMVFPVGIFIGKLRIGTTKTQRNAFVLLGITAIFILSHFINLPRVIVGTFLICFAVIFSFMEYKLAVYGRDHEDIKQFRTTKNDRLGSHLVLYGIALVLGIVGGGYLVVDGIEAISLYSGISTTILGLTLTAIATSLPELLTTIFSQKDHQEKITIGNVLGSNIYNLLLIGGIITFFPLTTTIPLKDWLWLTGATIIFVLILHYYKGYRPSKLVGIILMILFGTYLLSQ